MTRKYAYKGTNQDHETCEVCGKTDLAKVMWLVELDIDENEIGEAFATGTTCGARLLGYTQKDFSKAIKKAARKIEQKKSAAYHNHPLVVEAKRIRKGLGRKSPEFIKTKEMMQQAWKEVHSQDYSVTIKR